MTTFTPIASTCATVNGDPVTVTDTITSTNTLTKIQTITTVSGTTVTLRIGNGG